MLNIEIVPLSLNPIPISAAAVIDCNYCVMYSQKCCMRGRSQYPKLGANKDSSYESYKSYIESRPPEVAANLIICVIHQTNYLLDQQIRRLEQDFLKEGGLRERMTRARLAERARQNQADTRGKKK